jgi:UDP-N-acetylmuramate--alanine ligase
MNGAAVLLRRMGAAVSGSDLTVFEGLAGLVREGIRVSIGHRESQVDSDTDFVVASAAIPSSNPEVMAARRQRIPVIKYAQLLGLLLKSRQGVAIAGTHGKSTTTAMTTFLFRAAGLDPSFVIGARCDQLAGHSDYGAGPHLIVESCEFDRSFLQLNPFSAAILNIEADHLDCYRSLEEIEEAFASFAERVDPHGLGRNGRHGGRGPPWKHSGFPAKSIGGPRICATIMDVPRLT